MQRITRITDSSGTRNYTAENYPLTIGGPDSVIHIPGCHYRIASIGLEQSYPKLFLDRKDSQLWHNHQLLQTAVWLKSGDVIEYNEYRIDWLVVGDKIEASVSFNDLKRLPIEPSTVTGTFTTATGNEPKVPVDPMHTKSYRHIWLFAGLLVLLTFCGFILMARPVTITIEPKPDSDYFSGDWPAINLGMAQLALPGNYRLVAEKKGYRPLSEDFEVSSDSSNQFRFKFEKLPGLLHINTIPVRAQLSIDGRIIGQTPVKGLSMPAGQHVIKLRALRYQTLEEEIEVIGLQQQQQLEFTLKADWATITLTSNPSDAIIEADGKVLAKTPASIEFASGQHQLSINKKGYKQHDLELLVQADKDQTLPEIKLVKLPKAPPKPKAKPQAKPQTPQIGTLFITTQPADAELWVNGKKQANAVARLRLPVGKHQIKVQKKGYRSYENTVTTDSDRPTNLNIALKAGPSSNPNQTYINGPNGQRLIKINATPVFTIGASRREPGRRSNESLRKIQLTRAFFIAKTEVSNAQFRRFRSNHNSGQFNRFDLNDDKLPVVNISWQEAAAYTNWLSEQDGLPPAYQLDNGTWRLIRPVTTGYRLPTEAEWEYTARFARRHKPARFAWPGDAYPPVVLGGNFADASAQEYLPQTINDYNDGYAVSAPVESFQENPSGMHNLGGNVSEWVHDFYTIYPGMEQKLQKDPLGPTQGRHRVIKGASWKDASVSELRFSYRDYSDKPRDDVGFRIARYVQ